MADKLKQALGISDPPPPVPPQVLTPERLTQALDAGVLDDAQQVEAFTLLAYLRQVAALSPDTFAARYPWPRTMPPTPRTHRDWLRYCLELTPPFQTTIPLQVRDTRYPRRRPAGVPCQDYPLLVATLTAACVLYTLATPFWLHLPDTAPRSLPDSLEELVFAEGYFRFLRDTERTPPPLKGLHTSRVTAAFALVARVLSALHEGDRPAAFAQHRRYQARAYYGQLLVGMWTAFERYGPEHGFPQDAVYHALSSILRPLLLAPRGLLPAGCATPRAIQRRLHRWRTDGTRPLLHTLLDSPAADV